MMLTLLSSFSKNIKHCSLRKKIHKIVFFILSLIILFPLNADADDTFYVLNVSNKKIISIKKLVDELNDADIVIVGELHNEAWHHNFQLKLIEELNSRKKHIAVALEMFRHENQTVLDDWLFGRITLDDFIKNYYENWTFPWNLYSKIFFYAKENKIPLIGVNIPKEITQKVAEKGFFSLTKKDYEKLPKDVRCDVDEDYKSFIQKVFDFHKNKADSKSFQNFCEAQILWDKSMAFYILDYRKRQPNRQMVLLTGFVHTLKNAVATQLKRLDGSITVKTVLPEVPHKIDAGTITINDADYMVYGY